MAPQCARSNELHEVRLLRSGAGCRPDLEQDALDRAESDVLPGVVEGAADAQGKLAPVRSAAPPPEVQSSARFCTIWQISNSASRYVA
jgi:hypothetical protein